MEKNDVDQWIKNRKPHQLIPFSLLKLKNLGLFLPDT